MSELVSSHQLRDEMRNDIRLLRSQKQKLVDALSKIVNHPSYLLMEDGETGEPCELMEHGREVLEEVKQEYADD